MTRKNSNVSINVPEMTPLEVEGPNVFPCYVDRARYVLRYGLEKLCRKGQWQASGSVLLTVILALSTTNFKDAFKIPAEVWQALTIFIGIGAAFFFLRACAYAYKYRKLKPESLIEDLRTNKDMDS